MVYLLPESVAFLAVFTFFVSDCGEKWCIVGNRGIFYVSGIACGMRGVGPRRADMFRGVSGINIDSKGRMVLPVRYRESLHDGSGCVVLTIDTEEKCLLLYPMASWEDIEKKLAELPGFNPAARRIQRLLIGHATEVPLDSHGRILLPPLLRDYAGIERQVMLVGQGKKFELWAEAHWQVRRQHWLQEETTGESMLPEEVRKLSL